MIVDRDTIITGCGAASNVSLTEFDPIYNLILLILLFKQIKCFLSLFNIISSFLLTTNCYKVN